MPLLDPDTEASAESSASQLQRLPFPPVTYSHILHCSYHHWQPRYAPLLLERLKVHKLTSSVMD